MSLSADMRITVTLDADVEQRLGEAMRLRTGLDPARLGELDDDPEIAEFLRKTARLREESL